MKQLILATAGHVDHGKSALVKALTRQETDRLPEEKARGITIDLGFTELELSSEGDAPGETHLGVIDVPGHEDFVKNMLAGLGSIDLALLTVAADDGWMPQTEEHLQILTYLDVRHAVVALTKADLVRDAAASLATVHDRLRGSSLEGAPIVPTSIFDPHSLDVLREVLVKTCAVVPAQRDIGKPRLAVDRAFSLHGVGTIVTGTLAGGILKCGQEAVVQPVGLPCRIRALQSHHRDIVSAEPGQRVAVHLSNVAVAHHRGESGVRRGDTITSPGAGKSSLQLDVVLHRLARAAATAGLPALRSGSRVRVHHGSRQSSARLQWIDHGELEPGGRALARLHFDASVFVFTGDRFVLRDASGCWTLAGGVVLDSEPPVPLPEAQRAFLQARAVDPLRIDVFVRTETARIRRGRVTDLLLQSRFSAQEIAQELADLVAAKEIIRRGDLVLDPPWWNDLTKKAMLAIETEHRTHPEYPGLELSALRGLLGIDQQTMDLLLAELCGRGFERRATTIARALHRPALPPALAAAGVRLRACLASKPFEPPSRKELAADALSAQALRFLISTGEAIELGTELVMNAVAFERALASIVSHLKAKHSATAGELRETLPTSRRVIIPLLERLDRDGVTRRVDDRRVLRST